MNNTKHPLKMLTGLLANQLKINVTNIETLYMKPAEFRDFVSKGFIEKTYVFGPINSNPQNIKSLWNLTKIYYNKKKMDAKERNKTSTKFSETTATLNYPANTGFSKRDKNIEKNKSTELAQAIHQDISELKKTESSIPNITSYPVYIKYEKSKNRKSKITDRIKTRSSIKLIKSIKYKQGNRKPTNLMNIYVPIRKRVLTKLRNKTKRRKIKKLPLRRLGTTISRPKLNKQLFKRQRIQR